MDSVRQSPSPQSARVYEPSEPGHGLAGYLYNVEFAIATCMQATDFSDRPTVPADHRLDLLQLDFAKCRERFEPLIQQWHTELIESAKRIGLLAEVAPLLDKTATALGGLWDSATDAHIIRGKKLTARQAFDVATGKKDAPADSVPRLDTSNIRPRIVSAVEMIERLRRLWPHFDPACERVDAAIMPWERFYDLAVAVNDDASDMIYKNAADSPGRIAASKKLSNEVEGELTLQWRLAVQNALTDDMAARIDSACKSVRDRARDCLAFSIRTPQYGDRVSPETWKKLNDAVLAPQDLRGLQRRAVEAERAKARNDREDRGEPLAKWLTVTQAHQAFKMTKYEISRLATSGKIKTNGKEGRARRVESTSLIEFILKRDAEKTVQRLRKFVR